jgi:hypothetical protein
MRDLAVRILPVYQEDDTERYLENLSALQLTSGDYAAAYASQQSLRERRQNAYPDRLGGQEVVSDIYVRARAIEAQDKVIPGRSAAAQQSGRICPLQTSAHTLVGAAARSAKGV